MLPHKSSVIAAVLATALATPVFSNGQCLTGPVKTGVLPTKEKLQESLVGAYGLAVEGYRIRSQPADPSLPRKPPVYLAMTGTYVFDGKGNVNRYFDFSEDGEIATNISDSGTYVVNADCTATADILIPGGIHEFIKLTILQKGAIIMFMNVTPGMHVVLAGQMIRQ